MIESISPPPPQQSFAGRVIAEMMDLRPVALIATSLQAGIVFAMAEGLNFGCEYLLKKHQAYCEPELFGTVAGAIPAIVFWAAAILLTIVALWLFSLVVGALWVSVPLALVAGVVYLSTFLQPPLSSIVAMVGGILVLLGWKFAVERIFGMEPSSSRQPNRHEL